MCVFHSSQFTFMEATLKFQTEALPAFTISRLASRSNIDCPLVHFPSS